MTDLPEDFRDLLVELADAGADFVLIGGHAVRGEAEVEPQAVIAVGDSIVVSLDDVRL